LFIRLYLDEDVNVLVADLLRARGFDAITVRDAGQLRATDAEQLV
jgi:predicted nuclease of predicted toxin-antitoxin system